MGIKKSAGLPNSYFNIHGLPTTPKHSLQEDWTIPLPISRNSTPERSLEQLLKQLLFQTAWGHCLSKKMLRHNGKLDIYPHHFLGEDFRTSILRVNLELLMEYKLKGTMGWLLLSPWMKLKRAAVRDYNPIIPNFSLLRCIPIWY